MLLKELMKNKAFGFVFFIFCLIITASDGFAQGRGNLNSNEVRILIAPSSNASPQAFDSAMRGNGLRSEGEIPGIGVHLSKIPAHAQVRVLEALRRNPNIKFAEVDELIPPVGNTTNDTYFSHQWHLQKIGALEAWNEGRGEGIVVAVLDTGVDPNHSDLKDNLLPGFNSVDGSNIWYDEHGHGTRVAGVIAALTDNNYGVASIAHHSKILPVRISNHVDGWAYFSDIARGLTMAADYGVDIANISYSVAGSAAVTSAAEYMRSRGGLVVAAAGNWSSDLEQAPNPFITVVSATDSEDQLASFSSFGEVVDIAAPGVQVLTTSINEGFHFVNGTSFASPIVAGVAALVLSTNPALEVDEVEQILFQTAYDLGTPGKDIYFGHGRVDAAAATAIAIDFFRYDEVEEEKEEGKKEDEVEEEKEEEKKEDEVEEEKEEEKKEDEVEEEKEEEKKEDEVEEEKEEEKEDEVEEEKEKEKEEEIFEDTIAPSVSINNLNDGDNVSGHVNINISASDNIGVTYLACAVNGRILNSVQNSDSLNCSWNTNRESNGNYEISAEARDAAGNITIETITVRVGGGNNRPGNGRNR